MPEQGEILRLRLRMTRATQHSLHRHARSFRWLSKLGEIVQVWRRILRRRRSTLVAGRPADL